MKIFKLLCLILLFWSCKEDSKSEIQNDTYKSEISTYKDELAKSRVNYLQLTGLFKLDTPENTFGSSENNDFVIKTVDIPETLGAFINNKDSLSFTSNEELKITNKQDSTITSSNLQLDEYGSSIRMYYNHINWQVITRSGSLYLRVWDTNNPAIESFKGFSFFELNPELILKGKFTYYDNAKTESVKSQLGVNASTNFIGKVTFNYNNSEYSLDVGQNGFTMVADDTSGDKTYGGGRYIYLDLPETNGLVTIDFNKLYNPPCSFSTFTTCLYPPRQNALPFKILAGETITPNP